MKETKEDEEEKACNSLIQIRCSHFVFKAMCNGIVFSSIHYYLLRLIQIIKHYITFILQAENSKDKYNTKNNSIQWKCKIISKYDKKSKRFRRKNTSKAILRISMTIVFRFSIFSYFLGADHEPILIGDYLNNGTMVRIVRWS